jgi:hypothetical protein
MDTDGDGFDNGFYVVCYADSSYGYSTTTSGADCNDYNNDVYPGAPETNYNGIDEDCDGFDSFDVGIETENKVAQTVYPNPGNNYAFVKLNDSWNRNVQISIRNIEGSIVSQDTYLIESDGIISVLTQDLSNGVYIFSIQDEKNLATLRWIKQ